MLPDAAMVKVRPPPIKVLAQVLLKPLTTPTAHTEKHATLPPPQNALKDHSLLPLLAHQLPDPNAMLPDAAMVKVRPPPIKVLAQVLLKPLTTPTAHTEKHATLPPPQNAKQDHSLLPSLAHQKPVKNAMLPDAAMLKVSPPPIKVLAQHSLNKRPLTTPTAHIEKHATLPLPQNAPKDHSSLPLLAHQLPQLNAKLPDAAMLKVSPPPIEVLAQHSLKKRPLTTPTALSEKHATLPPPQLALKDHSSLPLLAHQLPQLNAKLPDAAMPKANPLPTEVPAHEHPDRLEASLRQ